MKAETTLGTPLGPVRAVLMDQAGLTREEANRVAGSQYVWLSYLAQVIPNVEELTALDQVVFENSVHGTYRQRSVGRPFWEIGKSGLHPDLVIYVDNVLAQPG